MKNWPQYTLNRSALATSITNSAFLPIPMPIDHTYLLGNVLFAHVHNWPSMTGNGHQQTLFLYCHCCYTVSNTRSVQMLAGYVLYRALVEPALVLFPPLNCTCVMGHFEANCTHGKYWRKQANACEHRVCVFGPICRNIMQQIPVKVSYPKAGVEIIHLHNIMYGSWFCYCSCFPCEHIISKLIFVGPQQ